MRSVNLCILALIKSVELFSLLAMWVVLIIKQPFTRIQEYAALESNLCTEDNECNTDDVFVMYAIFMVMTLWSLLHNQYLANLRLAFRVAYPCCGKIIWTAWNKLICKCGDNKRTNDCQVCCVDRCGHLDKRFVLTALKHVVFNSLAVIIYEHFYRFEWNIVLTDVYQYKNWDGFRDMEERVAIFKILILLVGL